MNNPQPENNLFHRLRDRLRERPWSFCILALILVALNTWWDFHHAGGFVLDVVFLFALFISYLKSKNS